MKFYHFTICFIVTATLAVFPISSDTFGEITPYLKLITAVDGKAFFAVNGAGPLRNWTTAGAYCNSVGMKLASIETAAQYVALNRSFSINFAGRHWTAGRDAHELRQFSWNGSNQEVSGDFNYRNYRSGIFESCLAFSSQPSDSSTGSYIISYPCTLAIGTLCEN